MKLTNRILSAMSLSVLAFLPQASFAVTAGDSTVKLSQVQGDVMVNNGNRFVKAAAGSELKPGAKIVTAKESSVTVVYQNGCVKKLQPNSMLTVGTAAECLANNANERVYVATAVGDTLNDANADTSKKKGAGWFDNNGKWIAGGLVIGTGIAVSTRGHGGGNNSSNLSLQ